MANNITSSPVKIANGGGVVLKVVGAGTVYVGQDAADPTATGVPLVSTEAALYLQVIHGPLYAATATGTVDLRVLSL